MNVRATPGWRSPRAWIPRVICFLWALAMFPLFSSVRAQSFSISAVHIGAGESSSSGNLQMHSAIGEPVAGRTVAEPYQLSSGFWPAILNSRILVEPFPTTITLLPAQGAPGAPFVASGRVAPGSTGVRILWDDGTSARGLAEGPVTTEGVFSLNLAVRAGSSNGPVTITALPLGSSGADSASATFTVLAAQAGSVSGRVVLQNGNTGIAGATVRLLSPEGSPVASTQSDAQGAFSFVAVPQGLYTLASSKDGYYSPIGEVIIPSGGSSANTLQAVPLDTLPAPAFITFVGAIAVPLEALKDFPYPVLVSDQIKAKQTGVIASFASLPSQAGIVPVRFWADASFPESVPQNDRSVLFEVIDPSGSTLWKIKKTVQTPVYPQEPALNFPAYTSSFPSIFPVDMNVSSFPPGEVYLRVTPYIGTKAGTGKIYIIEMADLTHRWFQPWVKHEIDQETGLPIRYNGSGGLNYILNASLPVSSILPFSLDIPVPVFDYTFQNRLGVSVPKIQEVFTAGEGLRPGALKPYLNTEAKLFSYDFSPEPKLHSPITDSQGNITAYDLPRVTALDVPELVNVRIYQNGPGIGCVNLCFVGCKVCAGWTVYVDFVLGGKIDVESHIHPDLALETRIIPQVSGTIGGHARIRLVVCNLDADITGTVSVDFPFLYQSNPDSAGFETACVQLSGNVSGDIGCLGIGFGGGGSIGPHDLFGCTDPPPPLAATAATAMAGGLMVDPAPSVAAGGNGNGLSVWVQDESTVGGQISPFVYYRFFGGNIWLPGQRLTPAAALVNEPKAALMANNRAVSIWVQNTRPLAEIIANNTANLSYQEIFASSWNGSQWSAPLALTQNNLADGSPSLAVSPNGDFAIAAWTHIQDPPPSNLDQVQSDNQFAIFNGTSWSTPQSIHFTAGKIDSQVAVKVDGASNPWAVWMRDDDADLTTFSDRRLFVSRRTTAGWAVPEQVPNTPPGAFSPAIALDSQNQPFVVFLVPPSFKGQLTSGLGNRSSLWYARKAATGWTVARASLSGRTAIYAEGPSVEITSDDKAIIVFRRFGEDVVHQTGDLASLVSDLTLPAVQFKGDYLTRDGQSNWKVSSALNPQTQQNLIVSVKQSPVGQHFAGGQLHAANASPGKKSLSAAAVNGPAISSIALDNLPDLTVSSDDIAFSNSHPLPGDNITISARVRNQGFLTLSNQATARFYDVDVTREAVPFHTAPIVPPLAFGDSITLQAQYSVRQGGIKSITVVLDADELIPESDDENNSASATLGEIPPPSNLAVVPDPALPGITLSWDPPATAGIRQYKIFRAEAGGRTLELIGTTKQTTFVDYLARPGTQYLYTISAHDDFGASSSVASAQPLSLPAPDPPPPPYLSVLNADQQVILSWFDSSNQFEPQYTDSLAATPRVWSRPTETVFSIDGQHQLIITPSVRARFYRLAKP